ncbi:hypothetical protein O6H91_06G068800 [Diphasiastrum complanatum]|uniref:Uncharacterized protein n=1 Tax=Diphasiastrum complanatum TaxID=34168 RepID=A0ACC2DER6_DIPCM|nr:hypothetical protein O6H91_06G068800 [Diphasiastrum complanatum]
MRCSHPIQQRIASIFVQISAYRSLPKIELPVASRISQRLEDAINSLDQQPGNLDTFARLIRECSFLKDLVAGRRVHAHISSSRYGSDRFLAKLLMIMYSNCGRPHEAWSIFDRLSERDIVSWNVMIGAYAQHGYGKEAIKLFDRMLIEGVQPDERTLTIVLNACSNPSVLAKGKQIHALIADCGLESHVILGTALVKMYSKCGNLHAAKDVFDSLPVRDLISWNTMIAAYVQHGLGIPALELFKEMPRRGLRPDKITFVSILSACASLGCPKEAKKIHAQLVETGLGEDLVLSNALVNMYSSCGGLADACDIFDKMTQRDVISWNTIIAAYAQGGHQKKAIELYGQMLQEGVKPDKVTYINVLNALENSDALEDGKAIHSQIVESGCQFDVVLGTALVNMYSKCGSVEDAVGMFNMLLERDAISWNAAIAVNSQHGQNLAAIGVFAQMQWEGVKLTTVTFVNLLNAFSNLAFLDLGQILHTYVIESGMQVDVVLGNALANMFVKCGNLEDAWKVFEKMPVRDVVSWNTMVGAYAQFGCRKTALKLFKLMQGEGVQPNKITILNILHAMDSPAALGIGKFIHAFIRETGYEMDVSVGNALLNMYSCCGSLEDARDIFNRMQERDLVTLNAMIGAFVQHGLGAEGLQLFKQMQFKNVKPDEITLVNVLDACSSLASLAEGKLVHAYIVECGFEGNIVVGNALVNMYGKCGSFRDAVEHFEKMIHRDIVTWNAIIEASNQHGHGSVTIQLFGQMQWEELRPDRVGFVSILSACSHTGNIDGGCHYFTSVGVLNLTLTAEHYGCIIDLFGRAGRLDEAENFITNMPWEGDSVMWMSLLGACRVHGDIERGKRAAEQVMKLEPNNAAPYVILSNMYATAARWDEATKIRNLIANSFVKKMPGHSIINFVHSEGKL